MPSTVLQYFKSFWNRQNWLPWLVAFIAVNQILWFTPGFSMGYYAIMLLTGAIFFMQGRIQSKLSFWLLNGVCAFSILFNDIPDFYHPWLRLTTFIIITSALSPFFHSPVMNATRLVMFEALMIFFSAITTLSMFLRPIGFVKYQHNRFFCGLTAHSMQLGAISALSLLYYTYLLFRFPPQKLWQKTAAFAIAGLSAMACMSSGSRAAFLGGGVAFFSFIAILFFRHSSKTRRMIIGLAVVAALSLPLWENSFAVITYKNHGDITNLDLSTRQHHWENLLESFMESPAFGKGFSYIEEERQAQFVDDSTRAGQIETGNSWLTVLAMTGAFGGLCVAVILLQAALSLLRILRRDRLRGAFLISVFIFFLLHMCAEGYVFSAGGLMFFSFWLFLGMVHAADEACSQLSPQPVSGIQSQADMPAPFPRLQ